MSPQRRKNGARAIQVSVATTNTALPQTSGPREEGTPAKRANPVAFETPVTVTGARPSSEGTRDLFTEETRTILVFTDGAVIQLAAGVSVGQLLFVTNKKSKEEVVCQILHKRIFKPTLCYVEVQFTEEKPNFWDVSFPKSGTTATDHQVVEQVSAEEKTEEIPGKPVGERSEQEVEQLKQQVETLRKQLQELEKQKIAGEAAGAMAAPKIAAVKEELAAVNDPVPATEAANEKKSVAEALLMPAAPVEEKKTPRLAVPMALPNGRNAAEKSVEVGREPSDELLPRPELDFSKAPNAGQGDESNARGDFPAKRFTPQAVRRIALGVALAGVVGVGVYVKAWTLFPVLKNAPAAVVQLVKEALGNRGGVKAKAPASSPAGKSAPGAGVGTNANASAAAPHNLAAGTAAATVVEAAPHAEEDVASANKGDAAAAPASGSTAKGTDAGGASSGENAAEPSRSVADVARKPVNGREKSAGKNRGVRAGTAAEQKAAETLTEDSSISEPKLVHAATPVYPPDAMRNYITGDVKAELMVGADGRVGEVKLISGPRALRDAAVEALKRYEYAPATQGGRAVPAKTTAVVKFWFNP